MSKGESVVAAGHELTAAAAAEILQDGGNAFDAALAGVFMTFVAEAVFSSPGGGGFLMARQAGSDASAPVRFLHRDAAEAPAGKRGRVLSDLRRFWPCQAGVSYRARIERHARCGAWPVRHPRSALQAADETPGRAGGACWPRRFPVERVPGLSLHRDRPNPHRQRERGAHLRAERQADDGGARPSVTPSSPNAWNGLPRTARGSS